MDTNAILSKIEKAAPGKVLESGRFGRADLFSVWIEASALHSIAKALKSEASLKMDWLENLSIAEIGDSLIASWFVRSHTTRAQVILRSSVTLASEQAQVELPSVREMWPMAVSFENEAAELYGIRFRQVSGEFIEIPHRLLVSESRFPMRKSYVIGKAAK